MGAAPLAALASSAGRRFGGSISGQVFDPETRARQRALLRDVDVAEIGEGEKRKFKERAETAGRAGRGEIRRLQDETKKDLDELIKRNKKVREFTKGLRETLADRPGRRQTVLTSGAAAPSAGRGSLLTGA